MNDNKLIYKFRNKNYVFSVAKIEENNIEFFCNTKFKFYLKIQKSDIGFYLSKLNKRKENTASNVEEKVDEYMQFIRIISHDIQILKALDQLVILLWENINYLNQ